MISKVFTAKKSVPLFLFLIAIVLFIAFRGSYLTRIPVFVDEAIYIRWSQIMRNEPSLRFLPLSDGKQPLFMWLTMPSLKLFSDPLVAGRVVSILTGLVSLFALSAFVYISSGNLVIAAISALIYAVLPFAIFFDRFALADSMLSAFGLTSLALGVLLVKKPRLDLALLLGGSVGLGLLTKSPAVFFYLWQLVLFIFFFDFRGKKLLSRLLRLGFLWFVVLVVSQAIYNILRLGPNFHLIGSRNLDYVFPLSEVFKHPLNPLVGNLKSTANWLWFLFTPPLVLALVVSFFGKNKKLALLSLALALLPLFAQGLIAKVYTSRYVLFAVTPLILPVALGVWEVGERIKKLWLAILIFLLWPVILSAALVTMPEKANLPYDMRHGYLEEWTAGWGQKETANYLIERAKQGETIIVGTDGFFGTLPDGLQIYTQGYPNITVIGGSPSIDVLPTSLTDSLKDQKNTVYLVANKSRIKLPPSELARLELIAEYKKPTRLDGTNESLVFYRLVR